MLGAVRYSQGGNLGKEDGGFQISFPHVVTSFVDKIGKFSLKVFNLVGHAT